MYRIAKVTTVYPEFVDQFSRRIDPTSSYAGLHEQFSATRFGWSDFFARHLATLGVTASEIYASVGPLEAAWARDHHLATFSEDRTEQVVIAQLVEFDPDVVFLEDLYRFDERVRDEIRRALPKRVRLIGWRAAPTSSYAQFRDLDLVLSFSESLITGFRSENIRAAKLRHGFASILLDEVCTNRRDLLLTFAGQLGSRSGAHASRHALLEYLLSRTPLQVWGSGGLDDAAPPDVRAANWAAHAVHHILAEACVPRRVRARVPGFHRASQWPANSGRPGIAVAFPTRCHSAVFGLEYFAVLARSQVTLNCHIDATAEDAGNMRLYEATGMGACVLTDWKPNLDAMFEADEEIVTFHSPSECVAKARALLADPALTKRIAQAGQQRTLRDYRIEHSIEQLHGVIQDLLSGGLSRDP